MKSLTFLGTTYEEPKDLKNYSANTKHFLTGGNDGFFECAETETF